MRTVVEVKWTVTKDGDTIDLPSLLFENMNIAERFVEAIAAISISSVEYNAEGREREVLNEIEVIEQMIKLLKESKKP